MKVKFTLSIGVPAAQQEDVLELRDDLTEQEIEDEYGAWRDNYLTGGWKKLEEGEGGAGERFSSGFKQGEKQET